MLGLEQVRPKDRYWLHTLLFLVTFVSTTVIGAGLDHSFSQGRGFDLDENLRGYARMWHDPSFLLAGLPFSLSLLTVLLTHEFGHYLAARHYGVDATLPFFLPAPTIGTFGAFIRIRSPILSKRILFDIGVAGPLAGFAVLLFPLALGVSLSRVAPHAALRGDLIFGTPIILRFLEWIFFPGTPSADILLHPIARAAWVGLLATALNLLPIGQLDGGHILYAFVGDRSKTLSRVFVGVLAAIGAYQLFTSSYHAGLTWVVWAVALFFLAMRHPLIIDPVPVGRTRSWLGLAALVVFVLSFTVAPIRANG